MRRFFCDVYSCDERLVRQWEDIRRFYPADADLRHICRELGISPRTVYRYKDLTEPPPRRAHGLSHGGEPRL